MVGQGDRSDTSALPPDEGFEVLGNETRMEILRALGEAGEPLQFSELRERVGVRDSGQLNYHLERVVGQFVRKRGRLRSARRAGAWSRSSSSGVVTETPVVEPTRIDHPCHYCGSPIGRCRRPSRPPGPWANIEFPAEASGICSRCRRRWRSRSRSARGTTPATASVIGVTAGTRSSLTRRVRTASTTSGGRSSSGSWPTPNCCRSCSTTGSTPSPGPARGSTGSTGSTWTTRRKWSRPARSTRGSPSGPTGRR